MVRFDRFLVILFAGLCAAGAARAEVEPIEEVRLPAGEFDPSKFGKVAVLQWAPPVAAQVGVDLAEATRYKTNNLRTIAPFIREAASSGAIYIVLPEFAVVGYPDIPELPPEDDNFRTREDIAPYVETVPGMTTAYLGKMAKELGVYIQIGLAEVDTGSQNYHNSIAVLGPTGEVVASYRKQHLYELEYDYLVAGTSNTVFDSPFGQIGLIVCSDVYDYGVLQKYRQAGIEVLALSTSWAAYNSGWSNYTTAALRTKSYVLAANHNYFPDSGVISPDGSTQSHIRQSDGIAYGFLPLVKSARR